MPKRRVLNQISLKAIAAVDKPCQEGAKAVLIKRAEPQAELLKMDDEHARGFAEILAEREAEDRRWEAEDKLWPIFSALRQSLLSILGDENLDANQRATRRDESIGQFVAALNEEWPDVAADIAKMAAANPEQAFNAALIKAGLSGDPGKRRKSMPKSSEETIADLSKQVEDLTAERDKALADVEKANEERDAEKARADDATEKLAKRSDDQDEMLKIGDREIRKSVVGEDAFEAFKAQQSEIAAEREKNDQQRLEKRAAEEMPSIAGDAKHKAALLKAVEGIEDEDTRKFVGEFIASAEKMTKASFDRLGHSNENIEKAAGEFMAKVSEIQARDKISRTAAMEKAETEFPEEFEAYRGADQDDGVAEAA